MRRAIPSGFLVAVLTLAAAGCGQQNIPNTDVPDTPENRDVVEFVEEYRKAVLEQDVGKILALVSTDYLDDNGTPGGDDDLDYERLKKRLKALREEVKDVRYDIRYRRIVFRRSRVLVDFTYSASFLVDTPDGDRWARRLSDNRLVLQRMKDQYRIVSGL
ncbi:MAG: hypothetical protein ACOCXM_03510 [Myxococcota bacterium]